MCYFLKHIILLVGLLIVACGLAQDAKPVFKNPLLSTGPDPWVIQHEGMYYYTHTSTDNAKIELRSTVKMEFLSRGDYENIFTPPVGEEYSEQLWAPELHFLDNKWYLYFAATHTTEGTSDNDLNRRMFVLENAQASPMNKSDWVFKGKIADSDDQWAIDGTILEYHGLRYFIWSGKSKDNAKLQQLYIAKMINPWTLEGKRVKISEPTLDWETVGKGINEGPAILKNADGNAFLVYSASGCWTDDYKLGLLTLKTNGNPLNPAHWEKSETSLFEKNEENGVYGPGHNSFFKSPDQLEDWILYHANSNSGDGCSMLRTPRMQRIYWNADGTPNLKNPLDMDDYQISPSDTSRNNNNYYINGEFDADFYNWEKIVATASGVKALIELDESSVISGPNSAKITVKNKGTRASQIQIYTDFKGNEGEQFVVNFKGRSPAEAPLIVQLEKSDDVSVTSLSRTIILSRVIQDFSFTSAPLTEDATYRLTFQFGNCDDGTDAWIDAVELINQGKSAAIKSSNNNSAEVSITTLKGEIRIVSLKELLNGTVQVSDISGTIIKREQIINQAQYTLCNVNNGIYIVTYSDINGMQRIKLCVAN